MDDTQARFLNAIAERLGADRIVELHLFSPIRQGVLETGVAVVATEAEAPTAAGVAELEVAAAPEAVDSTVPVHSTVPVPVDSTVSLHPEADRHVVFTARYRLTRKGPDRGKWLFDLSATADAPLATVDTVARGVMQRSREVTETERLSGDQLRTLLAEPAWRTAT